MKVTDYQVWVCGLCAHPIVSSCSWPARNPKNLKAHLPLICFREGCLYAVGHCLNTWAALGSGGFGVLLLVATGGVGLCMTCGFTQASVGIRKVSAWITKGARGCSALGTAQSESTWSSSDQQCKGPCTPLLITRHRNLDHFYQICIAHNLLRVCVSAGWLGMQTKRMRALRSEIWRKTLGFYWLARL